MQTVIARGFAKKWPLSEVWNMDIEGGSLMLRGRLFQILCAAMEKARSQKVLLENDYVSTYCDDICTG